MNMKNKIYNTCKLNKKENRIKMGAAAVLCALILFSVIYIIYDRNTRIALSNYVTVEYSGVNGYGIVTCTVDGEALAEKLIGSERDMEKRTKLTELAMSVTALAKQTGVSNGDEIDIVFSYDKALAKEMKARVKDSQYKVTVKGLEEGTKISLFENVEVIFAGMSPEAYVWIQNNWEDEYLKSLQFSVDKSTQISTGDTVIVTCQTSREELSLHGYVLDTVSASYKADRLSTYANSADQVDKELLAFITEEAAETIVSETEDATFRMLYKATGDAAYLRSVNDEKAEEVQLLQTIFMSRNGELEGSGNNYIFLVFSANISNSETKIPVYYVFTYTDGYTTTDGVYEIDHDAPEERYQCGLDYESLYQNTIGVYEGSYAKTELTQ